MDIVKYVLTQPSKEKALNELAKVNLTLRETELVHLLYFDGLTSEEAAEAMNVSVSTVSKCKKRANNKCKAVFEDVT